MILGSYTAIYVLTKNESVDFDTATLIYMYTEPTVTGIIVIFDFSNKQKQFFKSIELLHETDNKLTLLGLKRKLPIVKWQLIVFYSNIFVGNLFYNILSYTGGKPIIHSIYEYMSYGISFHMQNVIIVYYFTFGMLIFQNFSIINQRLETIQRPVGNIERMVQELQLLGRMHFDLCKSLKNINDVCATTFFLYSLRAFVEVCAWLLSLNGLLPKLRTDFTMMILCYISTVLYNATVNGLLKNTVRYFNYQVSVASMSLSNVKSRQNCQTDSCQ